MSAHSQTGNKITVASLRQMKQDGEKISSLTAYDAVFARVLDEVGIDVVLVGDSLGMVVQGLENTIPVTMDHMIYHSQMVKRGLKRSLLMVDMPFMSYASLEDAMHNATRLLKEAGAEIVKLEWGAAQLESVKQLTRCGIPVCAHLGLKPQSVHKLGGYRVQGRDAATAKAILEDAELLEEAGADVLLLECVPMGLAEKVSKNVSIPVIGIGAGPDCDGQVLVLQDILDIAPGKRSRFTHNFIAEAGSIKAAVKAFHDAVKTGQFPKLEHAFQ